MGTTSHQHITSPTRSDRRTGARTVVPLLLALVLLLAGSSVAGAQPPDDDPTTTAPTTTAAPPQDPTTTATTTTRGTVAPSEADPGPDEPVDDPATEPDRPDEPDPGAPQPGEDGDGAAALPTGPPPGYTDDQFRTFVEVVEACGPDPGVVCSRLLAWTGNRTLAEMSQWFVEVPVRIAIVIGLALLANLLVRRALERYLRRLAERPADDEGPDRNARRALRMATASTSLGSAATVIIFVIAALVALAQLNINVGPLLAGAGIAGVALGFGAQHLVRDILAGFFVIVEDQYGIGDVINAGPASGKVEGISLRVTKLRDVEGTLWFIPNGIISEVGNMTQRWARVILDVDVAYGSDHHEASKLIKEAADAMWQDPEVEVAILEEPELWGVERLGDSAVTIRIAVKCAPADQWKAARRLRSRIKDRFDEEGIEIPFPQQTVWMRTADPE